MCVSNHGEIHTLGFHTKGIHGQDEDQINFPTVIPNLQNITAIALGFDHTLCLDTHGNVFSFGSNEFGQLGIDQDILEFTHIPQKVDVPVCKQISCGSSFSMCVSTDGFIYAFGSNEFGQLGINRRTYDCIDFPKKIKSLRDIDFVECGGCHAFCKKLDDVIYCWGRNNFGQIAMSETFSSLYKPTKCKKWPSNIIDIKCGEYHTIVLTIGGDVYSCGSNYCSQLGRNFDDAMSEKLQKVPTLSDIVRVECGDNHTMCINMYNYFYVFGLNDYGQLGLGDTESRDAPTKHPSLSEIIDISKGGNHTFAKTSNNEIYAFGYNEYIQLGIKTDEPMLMNPIKVFQDNEYIWSSDIFKSKAKSARSIV